MRARAHAMRAIDALVKDRGRCPVGALRRLSGRSSGVGFAFGRVLPSRLKQLGTRSRSRRVEQRLAPARAPQGTGLGRRCMNQDSVCRTYVAITRLRCRRVRWPFMVGPMLPVLYGTRLGRSTLYTFSSKSGRWSMVQHIERTVHIRTCYEIASYMHSV